MVKYSKNQKIQQSKAEILMSYCTIVALVISVITMTTQELALKVQFVTIDENNEGQRIDNFLVTKLKGVPKSMIYRIIRKGEVRVNKKRIKPEYKLQDSDVVRVPPVRVSQSNHEAPSPKLAKVSQLEERIVYEDNHLIALNKPSGIAVHGGSGVSYGVIEALRSLRPQQKFIELVHRLDKETSGILLIAKKRSALKHLQDQLRNKYMQKDYLALVKGEWQKNDKLINAPLLKITLKSGERIVRVNAEGKPSQTRFKIVQKYQGATLIKASPLTGRTHQIRVHCQYTGHPIACDEKYSESKFDDSMREQGLRRLFLHAAQLEFTHPDSEERMTIKAELDMDLKAIIEKLKRA